MEQNSSLIQKYRKPVFCLFVFSWTMLAYFQLENWNFEMYFSPYLLISLFSVISIFLNEKHSVSLKSFSKAGRIVILSSSVIFSLFTLIADFTNYLPLSFIETSPAITVLIHVIYGILSFPGGMIVWAETLMFMSETYRRIRLSSDKKKADSKTGKKLRPALFFGISFLVTFLLYVLNLIIEFPGNLTPDSISQVTQINAEQFNDHHPFLHTFLIKIFYDTGFSLSGDANYAVALFCLFQVIVMALSFAYTAETIYRISGSAKPASAVLAYMLLMPYNLSYSCTVWKDVIFGAAVLVFVVTVLRILLNTGNRYLNYILLVLSSWGFSVYRNNGIYAIVLTLIFMFIILRKNHTALKVVTLASVIIAMTVKTTFMWAMDIAPTEAGESLSIPVQQIACVIRDEGIDSEDAALISEICSVDYVKWCYLPYISDPLKGKVTTSDYYKDHSSDYLKLWIKLGLKHPDKYIKAWVNQTIGYWNSGFNYIIYTDSVYKNEFGIRKTSICHSPLIDTAAQIKGKYIAFTNTPVFHIFLSIGLHFWILCLFALSGLINKRKKILLLSIPIISLTLSLLAATPVFCEFRYIYSMFLTLPVVIAMYFIEAEPDSHDTASAQENQQ